MATIRTSADTWIEDAGNLFTMWRRFGKERSQQKFRGTGNLVAIRRGVGCVHLVRGHEFSPHIHATIVTDQIADHESSAMRERIQSLGFGYVDFEPTWKSLKDSVGYSIAGDMPPSAEHIKELRGLFHGKHLVRRIGK